MRKFLKALYWLNLTFILLFWFSGSFELIGTSFASSLLALGRLAGLLSVFFVLMQFTLIGRIYWIERAFGHDKLAHLHHKLGKYGILLILAHFILILTSYSLLSEVSVFSQLLDFFQNYDDTLQAFVALCLFIIVVVTSISIVRLKLKYEAWYFVHLITYLAILLAFGHQLELGGDFANNIFVYYWWTFYAVVLGGFVIFRFGRPLYYFQKHMFVVKTVKKESWDTNSIYISGKDMNSFPRLSGQFFILRFLDKNRFWQAHPFSLSWSAKNTDIRITPKNSGDYTSSVHLVKPGTKVLVDGPLGSFTKDRATKSKFLFIAGGIGITPIRSLIEDLGTAGADMILLYSNKLIKDIVFKDELEGFAKKYKLSVYNVLTEEPSYKGEVGRIDKEKITRLAKDVKNRDVYLCGPKPFMDAMISMLKELGVPDNQIHFEKFSLH